MASSLAQHESSQRERERIGDGKSQRHVVVQCSGKKGEREGKEPKAETETKRMGIVNSQPTQPPQSSNPTQLNPAQSNRERNNQSTGWWDRLVGREILESRPSLL